MPSITQSLSATAKKTYNSLKKEYDPELVFEELLGQYKGFSKAETEKEKLAKKLEYSKEKIAELTKQLKEKPSTTSETAKMQNPDTTAMLNGTIAALTSLNESYARENERLLKIVNFSEYDEKINGLKAEITAHSKTILELRDSLKAEKGKSVDLEIKAIDLEKEKEETVSLLEGSKTEVSELVNKLAKAEDAKAQLESTVTSYVEELRRYKDKVEEMKTQIPPVPPAGQESPEVSSYNADQ
ncbi:MAG: hypothetical protein AB8G05_27365 [Oligoflexales bacterium]